MKLYIEFDKIVDAPMCQIAVNDQVLYRGVAQVNNEFELAIGPGPVALCITHWDKQPQDTVVEHGQIVRDRSFEIAKIKIDDLDLEELIWHSEFRADDGQVYPSCLFFGPNGTFVLNAELPILRWMLQTRHQINNNDPYWEQDYNYYIKACQILKQT